MDKTSFFFTANCGICHPGGAAMQYDRTGKLYYDRATGLYGYGGGVATLPASPAGSPPSGAQLDGDYGFIVPSTGVPTTGNWAKNGVTEADCLMCHLRQYGTGPGTANADAGLSWWKRAATLRGFGAAGVTAFEWAPTAGAGWANVTYVAGASPPQASAVTINYNLGVAAGTLVSSGGNLAIPLGKIGGTGDSNCWACHATPDGKKSGRTLSAARDVHLAGGVGCTRCHPATNGGVKDSLGLAMSNPHQIGKGDITIGSVRNDLDNTMKNCADCHLNGADPLAPDPTAKHVQIPGFHFGFIGCKACHIRYVDGDPAAPMQQVPDLVIEMTSNGTQNVSLWNAYFGTDPIDPTRNLAGLPSGTFRWYPAVRWYKGKLTTVKPLLSAWFGEWLGGTGDAAIIRPLPLRLVRKTLANAYAPGSPRVSTLTLTPGTQVATGAPILHRKDEIRAFLVALRDAADTANPDTAGNDIVARPVLVRGEKVYYLNAVGDVEFFESLVGESHDFAVSHDVVAMRDPANPIVKPGPYGAGGCNDCHGPNSPFFYARTLADPAQYDFLDGPGTVPNPDAGKPRYVSHYEIMGYTADRAAQLTATAVPLLVHVYGAFGRVAFGPAGAAQSSTCDAYAGGCKVGFPGGSSVNLTATATSGASFLGWSGCTPGVDPLTCTVTVPVATSGVSNPGVLVEARFGDPPPPPPPTSNALVVHVDVGQGTISGGGIDCRSNAGWCGMEVSPVGSTVNLTATAWNGYTFSRWTGCTSATGSSCSVTVSKNTLVTAEFTFNEYPVTVSIDGAKGLVTGSGFYCQSNTYACLVAAAPGSVLTLNAAGVSGSTFLGWSGCTTTSGATCTVTVGGPLVVHANFSP